MSIMLFSPYMDALLVIWYAEKHLTYFRVELILCQSDF